MHKPYHFNTAQKLLMALGVDDLRLMGHMQGLRETSTKAGPGRKHVNGATKLGKPNPPKGAFSGQRTNPKRAKRRALIKAYGGIRHFKRITEQRRWTDVPF